MSTGSIKAVFYDPFFERVEQAYQELFNTHLPQLKTSGVRSYNHFIAIPSKKSPLIGLQMLWGNVEIGKKGKAKELELRIQIIKDNQKRPFEKMYQYTDQVLPYPGGSLSEWGSFSAEKFTPDISMKYCRVPHPDAHVTSDETSVYMSSHDSSTIFKLVAEILHHHIEHLKEW